MSDIQLASGGIYITRNGCKFGPIRPLFGAGDLVFQADNPIMGNSAWRIDGSCGLENKENPLDIVAMANAITAGVG